MNSSEIRRRFLNFFEDHGHHVQDSAPLLTSDPDLLFNIAGMVPFKPYFLGKEDPPDTRVTTAQKCIRTEDIDQVGETARHLTFFEMLGNFSFGDYFKEDAIRYGWEFLVEEMKLDPDRLWITVFGGDEELDPDTEAESIWKDVDAVRDERILHLNREENFWAMGATGPCGPCSEIMYDQESANADPQDVKRMILDGKDRILELWNLVFMEFERPEEDADLRPLPEKNIDTGLGLERLAAIKQNADSNFGTDLFRPVIRKIEERIDGKLDNPTTRTRCRVIADHLRASCFLLGEGLLPGNEGRGYVLRRLIRRAHLRGRRLGLSGSFLPDFVATVVDIMGGHFEELSDNQESIRKQLTQEEEQFERILDQGLDELDDRIRALQNEDRNEMDGTTIFDLYETHGLPVEMTKDVLDDEGLEYDEDEIEQARQEHEQRSRDESGESDTPDFDFEDVPETEFTGYDELTRESEILALYEESDPEFNAQSSTVSKLTEPGYVVLDQSPFYPEGGGQSGDRGTIGTVPVHDTIEMNGRILHFVEPKRTGVSAGETVTVRVDQDFRLANTRHHTATHLLHYALRQELGDQVMQDGSSLDDESLRFDFTYGESVDRDTLDVIENQVNEWIERNVTVRTRVMDRERAEEEGALAFFGEHYGQQVRVVSIVDEHEDPDTEEILESKEFCGGTHLERTGEVGVFTITNETAVAAGVRRIEAKAGKPAYDELKRRSNTLGEAADEAGLQQYERLPLRISELRTELDDAKEELERLRQQQSASRAEELAENPEIIEGCPLVVDVLDSPEDEILKTMVDEVQQRLDNGLILLIGRSDSNVRLVLSTTGESAEGIDAGQWIRELGQIVGGGGGGRPDFAEAGGSDPEAVPEVVDRFKTMVNEKLAETARN